MRRAMTLVVCNVVALVVPRLARLVGNRPPRWPTPPEVRHGPLAHAPVRDPTHVLHLGMAKLPRRQAIAAHVGVRGLARQVIHQAAAMDHTRGAVMPLIVGHVPGWRGRLPRLDPRGVVACLDPKPVVEAVVWPGLEVRGMGTQAVCGHDALEVRVVLAPLGHDACGGVACTILVVGALWWDEGCWPHGHHGPHVRMEHRRAQPVMSLRRAAVAVDLWPT
jgi:hypothetical protein